MESQTACVPLHVWRGREPRRLGRPGAQQLPRGAAAHRKESSGLLFPFLPWASTAASRHPCRSPLHSEKAPRLNALHRKPSPCVPSDAAMGAATAPGPPQPTSNNPPHTVGTHQTPCEPSTPPDAGQWRVIRRDPGVLPTPETPVAPPNNKL